MEAGKKMYVWPGSSCHWTNIIGRMGKLCWFLYTAKITISIVNIVIKKKYKWNEDIHRMQIIWKNNFYTFEMDKCCERMYSNKLYQLKNDKW